MTDPRTRLHPDSLCRTCRNVFVVRAEVHYRGEVQPYLLRVMCLAHDGAPMPAPAPGGPSEAETREIVTECSHYAPLDDDLARVQAEVEDINRRAMAAKADYERYLQAKGMIPDEPMPAGELADRRAIEGQALSNAVASARLNLLEARKRLSEWVRNENKEKSGG